MADTPNKAFQVQSNQHYRLDNYADDLGYTPAYARRKIRKLLQNKHLCINVVPFDQDKIKEQTAIEKDDQPDSLEFNGIHQGICFVLANVESDETSANTAPIFPGKFIVFDTVTGSAVTGIHNSWGPDQYQILGVALESFPRPDDTDGELKMIAVEIFPMESRDTIRQGITKDAVTGTADGAGTFDVYQIEWVDGEVEGTGQWKKVQLDDTSESFDDDNVSIDTIRDFKLGDGQSLEVGTRVDYYWDQRQQQFILATATCVALPLAAE